MQTHPLCELFPVLDAEDLAALAVDIKAHGQREPILLFEGAILDGRNRFKACQMAGVAPKFKAFTGDDPAALVASLNLHRRHLNESQRAMLAAELLKSAPQICGVAAEASKLVSVSTRSVESAVKVTKHGSLLLKKAVFKGDVSVSKAASVSHLPKPQQLAAAKEPVTAPTLTGGSCKTAALKAVTEVRDSLLGPYTSWDARTVRQFAALLEKKLESTL